MKFSKVMEIIFIIAVPISVWAIWPYLALLHISWPLSREVVLNCALTVLVLSGLLWFEFYEGGEG